MNTDRYKQCKRRMWATRDFKARLNLMFLMRGIAWQEREKAAAVTATSKQMSLANTLPFYHR